MALIRRPALFKRLPGFRSQPGEPQDIVAELERNKYPDFASDFRILETELLPTFRELDNEAYSHQNLYRWMYLILIVGSMLVTIVTILQIAYLHATWIDYIGGSLAALLAVVTGFLQPPEHQKQYFNSRLGAERLRSEYFLFLRHTDRYEDAPDRVQKLVERVVEIKREAQGSGNA